METRKKVAERIDLPGLSFLSRWSLWLTLWLAAAAGGALARLVYRYRTFPFDGDEVNHALPSLMMSQAIRAGDWAELARIFYDQSFYPPAMALLRALAFALTEPSFFMARLFSVACLLAAVAIAYALSVEMDPRRGGVAGLIAAALMLSSTILIINAGLAMVELPGLLVSLLLLWIYVRALKRPSTSRLLLAGLLLPAVFLTKYTYGLAALAAVALTEASLLPIRPAAGLRLQLRERLRGRWPWLLGPFLLVITLWFLDVEKLGAFISYTRPLADDAAWLSLANAGQYLRSFAIHNQPSPLFALVSAAGLVWAAGQWRRTPLRPILLYFLVGMTMILLINHPVNPRFILTFAPVAHVLTGLMIAWLIARLRDSRPAARARFAIPLALIGALALLSLPDVYRRWDRMDELMRAMVETNPGLNSLGEWLLQEIPPDSTVVMVNYIDQFDSNMLTWYMGRRHRADLEPAVSALLLEPPTAETLAAARNEILAARPDYVVVFEGGLWGYPFWPDYTAALEDTLVLQDRREFIASANESVRDWLDGDDVTSDEWIEISRTDLTDSMAAGALVFKVENSPPH